MDRRGGEVGTALVLNLAGQSGGSRRGEPILACELH